MALCGAQQVTSGIVQSVLSASDVTAGEPRVRLCGAEAEREETEAVLVQTKDVRME